MTPEARAVLSRKMRAICAAKRKRPVVPPNRGLMRPDAASKCRDCGTTLASTLDVKLHWCVPLDRGRTRAIDLAYGWGDTKR